MQTHVIVSNDLYVCFFFIYIPLDQHIYLVNVNAVVDLTMYVTASRQ